MADLIDIKVLMVEAEKKVEDFKKKIEVSKEKAQNSEKSEKKK